jgi:hypothetical protein
VLRVLNVPGGVSEIMSIEMDRQVHAHRRLRPVPAVRRTRAGSSPPLRALRSVDTCAALSSTAQYR